MCIQRDPCEGLVYKQYILTENIFKEYYNKSFTLEYITKKMKMYFHKLEPFIYSKHFLLDFLMWSSYTNMSAKIYRLIWLGKVSYYWINYASQEKGARFWSIGYFFETDNLLQPKKWNPFTLLLKWREVNDNIYITPYIFTIRGVWMCSFIVVGVTWWPKWKSNSIASFLPTTPSLIVR